MKTHTQAKHTAAYRAQPLEGPGHWQIIDDSCIQIALVRHWPESDGLNSDEARAETKRKAVLLAEAPELLALLVELTDNYEALLAEHGKPFRWGKLPAIKAREAIARATGTQP